MINSTPVNTVPINVAGVAGNPAEYVIDTFFVDTSEELSTWQKVFGRVSAAGVVDERYVIKHFEQISITANMATFYNPQADVAEQMLFAERPVAGFNLQITEQFAAEGIPSFVYVASIAEALVATGVAQTFFHGVVSILARILAADIVRPATAVLLADELAIEASALEYLKRVAELLEEVTVAATTQNTLTILVEETAALQAADTVQLTAKLLAELADEVNVHSLLKTPSEIAQGWILNTEAAMPISEYDNFKFDSLTQFKGVFYGTSDSGLYVMGADTDAGEPIMSELSSMMLDFGTSRQKRMRSAYLGYTSESELVLKVRSVSDGQLFEHWYKASPITAAAPRGGRISVGQGLRSRYWQFELTNVDGGDFEIDQLEMHPLFLGRRV